MSKVIASIERHFLWPEHVVVYNTRNLPLRLLDNKRKEIGDAANKLRNGLDKLIDTRQKVEAMTVELEETKGQLAIFQKQCEEYLVVIVQQKRDAEEQEKSVAARSDKIALEEARCQVRKFFVSVSPIWETGFDCLGVKVLSVLKN